MDRLPKRADGFLQPKANLCRDEREKNESSEPVHEKTSIKFLNPSAVKCPGVLDENDHAAVSRISDGSSGEAKRSTQREDIPVNFFARTLRFLHMRVVADGLPAGTTWESSRRFAVTVRTNGEARHIQSTHGLCNLRESFRMIRLTNWVFDCCQNGGRVFVRFVGEPRAFERTLDRCCEHGAEGHCD